MNFPKSLIIHHAGGSDANPLLDTSNQTFQDINEYHRIRFGEAAKSSLGFYCGYHYVIDKVGKVTQGRLDSDTGVHTIGMNESSLGICLIGNFDATLPSDAQKQSLKRLLIEKTSQYGIKAQDIVPHRTYSQKTCYGLKLGQSWARNLVVESLLEKISFIQKLLIHFKAMMESKKLGKIGSVDDRECGGVINNF